jgi:plastocyanin
MRPSRPFGGGHRCPYGAVLVALALGLAMAGGACGGRAGPAAPAGPLVRVSGDDTFRFAPEEIRVPAGQTITVEFANRGRIPHDFTTRSQSRNVSIVVQGAATGRGTFVPASPGRYEFVCAQPGHEAAGMKGVLIVE